MEHFILEVDGHYTAPSPGNCDPIRPGRLDSRRAFNRLPERLLFFVEPHMQMVYTGIVTYPSFLLSQKALEAVQMYHPHMPVRQVVFYDRQKRQSMLYCLPFLEPVECFAEGSLFGPGHSYVRHARIDRARVAGRALFRAAGVECTCVLIREDLAESLLRRGTAGIGLRETETVCRKNKTRWNAREGET